MTERTATFCGYTLFATIFLTVAAGIYGMIQSRRAEVIVEDNSPSVTVAAHIGTNTDPPILYVVAHIKKGYHIYSINPKIPEPIRTLLSIEPNIQDFGVEGDWFAITEPKVVNIPGFGNVEEHAYGAAWGIHIISKIDIKGLKIKGTLTVAPCNDDHCCLPETIAFEATVVK